MNRLGFRHDNLRRTMPEVLASPHLRLDAVYTHFATADDAREPACSNSSGSDSMRRVRVVDELRCTAAPPQSPAHQPASRICVTRPTARRCCATRASGSTSSVRGCCSTASCRRRWRRRFRCGRDVAEEPYRRGEGHPRRRRRRLRLALPADAPRTIAIVPAGYADGLDTRLSGRGQVLVRGQRVPIVGAVCMDMIMVDVTGLDVSAGRRGRDSRPRRATRAGSGSRRARVAAAVGTIPWEVLCRLGSRIEGNTNESRTPNPRTQIPIHLWIRGGTWDLASTLNSP